MLRELENVSQHEGEPLRRWFYSQAMDLVLWQDEEGAPSGFQLSYEVFSERSGELSGELAGQRKILTWLSGRGYSHESLDEGEDRPFRYKMTPVAVPDGVFNQEEVLDRFLKESEEIDSDVREFVAGKLREYPL